MSINGKYDESEREDGVHDMDCSTVPDSVVFHDANCVSSLGVFQAVHTLCERVWIHNTAKCVDASPAIAVSRLPILTLCGT